MTYQQNPRDLNPDILTVYTKGTDLLSNSWRTQSQTDDAGRFNIQRREPLAEEDITLDEAKVIAIEADSQWTATNQYFTTVAVDARFDELDPFGIQGDQTGNTISWDGKAWRFSEDVWFTRQFFESNLTRVIMPWEMYSGGNHPVVTVEDRGNEAFNAWDMTFHPNLNIIWKDDRAGASRVISVKEEADFGPLVGGFYELERFRRYVLDNNVTVNFPLKLPDGAPVEIVSSNFNNNDLRCQIGSQALFNGDDISGLVLRDIGIEDRDGLQATCFDITQAGSNAFSKIIMQDVTLIEFASLGTMTGFNSVKIKDNRLALYNEGLTLKDCDIIGIEGNLYLGLLEMGAIDITFEGTNGTLSMNAETWSQDDNAVAMNILATSTITQGTVTNSTYAFPTGGSFFAAGSKDQTDPSWRFAVNGELPDSNIIASASFTGNSTETVIAAANTPVPVVGTTVAGALERFTHNAAGILTYIGTRDITMRVEGRATIEINANLETKAIAFYVYVGGVQVAPTVSRQEIASVFQTPTSPEFVSVDNVMISPGDTLQLYVENQTDTTNITVTELKLVV